MSQLADMTVTPGSGSPTGPFRPDPAAGPQAGLTPDVEKGPTGPGPVEALSDLMAGNDRFVKRRPRHGHDVAAAAAASGGQQPFALVVGCMDSRVPLEAIFDQTFGAICVVRSGGQVLDRAMVGSVEFAIGALGVPLVMVLGHERCGAVAATVEAVRGGRPEPGGLAYLIDEIAPAVHEVGIGADDVHALAMRRHVQRTVAALNENEIVAVATDRKAVAVVGAVYDLDTGRVELLERP